MNDRNTNAAQSSSPARRAPQIDEQAEDQGLLRLDLLPPDLRDRFLASEKSGASQPGTRLMKERLGFPQFCRLRDCRRGKACLGKKFACMRDNRELMLTEVLPRVMGYERDADH
jgi:hypothetical protein